MRSLKVAIFWISFISHFTIDIKCYTWTKAIKLWWRSLIVFIACLRQIIRSFLPHFITLIFCPPPISSNDKVYQIFHLQWSYPRNCKNTFPWFYLFKKACKMHNSLWINLLLENTIQLPLWSYLTTYKYNNSTMTKNYRSKFLFSITSNSGLLFPPHKWFVEVFMGHITCNKVFNDRYVLWYARGLLTMNNMSVHIMCSCNFSLLQWSNAWEGVLLLTNWKHTATSMQSYLFHDDHQFHLSYR